MGSKDQYEARKAERKARQRRGGLSQEAHDEQMEMMNLFDRFVTAAERIADSLEAAGGSNN